MKPVDPLVQTAEHLTAASLRRSPTPTAPLPPSAAGAPNSAYAEALIRQQEERQQVPAVDRANSTFKEDVEVPDKFRAKLQDYFRSGYDRGHMVPAYVVHNLGQAIGYTKLTTHCDSADAKMSQVKQRLTPPESAKEDCATKILTFGSV